MSLAQKIFKDAQTKRAAYPLPYGIYKLEEAVSGLMRSSENIRQLMEYSKRRHTLSPSFIACTWEDKAAWLKNAVLDIAHTLGYEILPSIDAMKGDGLKQAAIDQLKALAMDTTPELLVEVDRLYGRIRRKISYEYLGWKDGNSEVQDLILRTAELGQRLLNDADLAQTASHRSSEQPPRDVPNQRQTSVLAT